MHLQVKKESVFHNIAIIIFLARALLRNYDVDCIMVPGINIFFFLKSKLDIMSQYQRIHKNMEICLAGKNEWLIWHERKNKNALWNYSMVLFALGDIHFTHWVLCGFFLGIRVIFERTIGRCVTRLSHIYLTAFHSFSSEFVVYFLDLNFLFIILFYRLPLCLTLLSWERIDIFILVQKWMKCKEEEKIICIS